MMVKIGSQEIETNEVGVPIPREVKVPMPEPERQLPPNIPTAYKGNGGGKDPRDALAKGLLQYDVLKAERDNLDKDLTAARERIRMLELQLEEIEGSRATIESRINTCVLQRDEAVREAGALHGVLDAIAIVCNKYLQQNAPQQD